VLLSSRYQVIYLGNVKRSITTRLTVKESIGSDAFLFPDTDKLAYFGKVVKPIRKTLQKIDNLIGKIVEIIASKNHFSTKKYLMWKT